MTAPEDQNGLREALAGPALREEVWNCVGGSLEDRSRWVSAIIAGPIARLIAERDAAVVGLAQATANIEKLHSALSGAALVLKARDRAAEAEITRLKEGMEALGAALRPFAEISPFVQTTDRRDGERVHEQQRPGGAWMVLTRADFRRAEAAYLATLSPK